MEPSDTPQLSVRLPRWATKQGHVAQVGNSAETLKYRPTDLTGVRALDCGAHRALSVRTEQQRGRAGVAINYTLRDWKGSVKVDGPTPE